MINFSKRLTQKQKEWDAEDNTDQWYGVKYDSNSSEHLMNKNKNFCPNNDSN